jgi:hypothetical protein
MTPTPVLPFPPSQARHTRKHYATNRHEYHYDLEHALYRYSTLNPHLDITVLDDNANKFYDPRIVPNPLGALLHELDHHRTRHPHIKAAYTCPLYDGIEKSDGYDPTIYDDD